MPVLGSYTSGVFDSELFPSEYSVFRKDRCLAATGLTRGGGVLIGIKKSYLFEPIDLSIVTSSTPRIDIIGGKLHINFVVIHIYVVYIPPDTALDDFELFLDQFALLNTNHNNSIIIAGDFNIPSFNIDNTDNKHILINNFMELCDLQQSNNVSNTNNRYLDLVFSNIHNTTSKYDMPLVCEDRHHPSLLIEFSIKLSHTSDFLPNKVEHVFNFRKANYPLLYELVFSADWSDVLLSDDVDSASVKFEQILHGIFEKTVPFKIVPRRKFPPWFSVETIRKIKQKHRAHKKFKKNGSQIHYEQFASLRNEIKIRIADEHRNFVLQAEIGIKTDPSNFWSYIRNKKGNSRIPGIMRYGDQTYTNQQDIVNGFASYFSIDLGEVPSPFPECGTTLCTNANKANAK
nr:unnamed protein product [Callosobruchus chinensis]